MFFLCLEQMQFMKEHILGTAIARPLIAKDKSKLLKKLVHAVAHGATGKGNDQVRFELGYYANNSEIKVVWPWREWIKFKKWINWICWETPNTYSVKRRGSF